MNRIFIEALKIMKKVARNWHLSTLGQVTTCSKIICDVQLWRQEHQVTIAKTTSSQQPQLQMFVFHVPNHHICVVLRCSVRHIGGWKYPKFMHKSKHVTSIYPSSINTKLNLLIILQYLCVAYLTTSGCRGKNTVRLRLAHLYVRLQWNKWSHLSKWAWDC